MVGDGTMSQQQKIDLLFKNSGLSLCKIKLSIIAHSPNVSPSVNIWRLNVINYSMFLHLLFYCIYIDKSDL